VWSAFPPVQRFDDQSAAAAQGVRLIARARKKYSEENAAFASRLAWLGKLYEDQARLYKQALSIQEKVFGPDHVIVSTALNNLFRMT
jgi:hypothetical protein